MKKILMALVLTSSVSAFAVESSNIDKPKADPTKKELLHEDRTQVNNSCSAESTTAGCEDKKVGSGLLKCIHEYKKKNKEFKVSEACEVSLKKLRADRKNK